LTREHPTTEFLPSLFQSSATHLDLHSFPTRRSSDLRLFAPEDLRLESAEDGEEREGSPERDLDADDVALYLGRHERAPRGEVGRSEEHTSELQSRENLVCRLLLEKKKERGPYAPPPP